MNRFGPGKTRLIVVLAVLLAAGTVGAGFVAVANFSAGAVASGGEPVVVRFALALPDSHAEGPIDYVVESSDHVRLATGTLPVPASPSDRVLVREVAVPPGNGHTVTFTSRSPAAPGGTATLATRSFDVVAGKIAEVSLAARSTPAPPSDHGSLSRAAELAAGDERTRTGTSSLTVGANGARDCQSCQLASTVGSCDRPLLTATSNTNAATGEQTGIGWGCGTLPSESAQRACTELIRCLGAHGCARGNNPVIGCFCGTAAAAACIGGNGVDGVCIPEYRAAATASAGGPPATASVAQFARFIATAASDPTTAVGLADNIKQCAIAAGCGACDAP
ncbi:MAG: hypothetical protein ABUS79_25870 [Pseudomonadota bacterium]